MIFCVAGIDGTQNLLPRLLIQMAEEYCRAYECGWQLEEFLRGEKIAGQDPDLFSSPSESGWI